ncbi:MAG: potassium-transporting ATPase subunit KdpA [Actinomycetota bacterium]|nr:potassium-transporting ATPase subunit KdpA [Actinomycetota bacterium]
MQAAITIAVLVIILAVAWRFLGDYLAAVYGGRVRWLAPVERLALRALGVDPTAEQDWKTYAVSLLAFSLVAIFFTYAIQRLQGFLPLNPQHLPGVTPALAFNTAVSFVTNTNWQNYAGETTMSYFTQMAALAVQMFASAAVGMAVAIALVRGLAARKRETIGNFWVDVVRGTLYVLLPIAAVAAVVFVAQGAVQTLAGPAHITDALNGVRQTIPRGPVASQEAIKQLGTNGGGFFNANGAHPFENPTPVTNFLSVVLILIIPVALTRTFGKMVGSMRQGVAILAVMTVIFAGTLAFTAVSESRGNAAVRHAGITAQASGNLVGKETRFGTFDSALYDVTSTQTSTGSVDSAADSYTPLGGLGMLSGMMLGEVSPGGVGSGLYTILLFAVLAVFIGGLMVGRTPEYLGKKIQAKEVQLATIGILVMPITVLVLTAIAVETSAGRAGPLNAGPHGFSEILYAFTSQGNNNGSAFAGLSGNTDLYNIAGGIAMLLGRFGVILPTLALAGSLAGKTPVPEGEGTFRTDSPIFGVLLTGVLLIVGGLTFFPALALGPIAEQLAAGRIWP